MAARYPAAALVTVECIQRLLEGFIGASMVFQQGFGVL